MKQRIVLLMAAVMMAVTPGSAALAGEVQDVVIVEDETEAVLEKDTEAALDGTETEAFLEEMNATFVDDVEEVTEDEPASISEDEPATIASSGTCGNKLTWKLSSDGTLTISGTGKMDDYEYELDESTWLYELNTPWGENDSISKVVIKNGVTSIGNYAFCGCKNVNTIEIANSVTHIGSNAFNYCAIVSITIPDSVKTIDGYAFMFCEDLTDVVLSSGMTSIEDGLFIRCTSLKNITIPTSIISIGNGAFSTCTSLTSIDLPDSITTIENGAFIECGLTSIIIPDGVTEIKDETFLLCYSLSSVSIPESVTSIGDMAFDGCSSLASISLPSGLEEIGSYAFCACDSLHSLTIPKSVKHIGEIYAIGYCIDNKNNYYVDNSFIIYGYTDTTAETYAKENNITFVALEESSATVTLAAGKISSLTNTSSGIKIKWTQVSGADGYYIYRKTGSGSYSKIKTIKSASTVSYTDKKVVDNNGTTYTYKVVPYSGSTKGTGTAKTTVRLTGTTLTSVKNSAAGKAKVKWTAVTSVTGYQIQYSTSSSFSSYKTKKVSGATSVSKTLSSLTKGKTYYVRIRTYKTVNGTAYYSAWSSKLKVKITK